MTEGKETRYTVLQKLLARQEGAQEKLADAAIAALPAQLPDDVFNKSALLLITAAYHMIQWMEYDNGEPFQDHEILPLALHCMEDPNDLYAKLKARGDDFSKARVNLDRDNPGVEWNL